MPLSFVALAGLIRKQAYGFVAALLSMAIGVYFPLVFAFQRWPSIRGTILAALVVFAVPSLLGIMGLYANRGYFFRNPK
jgi:urea transporter